MAQSQDNGITILLGLEDCKVGEVCEEEDRVIVRTEVKGCNTKIGFRSESLNNSSTSSGFKMLSRYYRRHLKVTSR